MVTNEQSAFGRLNKPIGYKVAGLSRAKLRWIGGQLQELPDVAACYTNDGCRIDALRLLEVVLFKAECYLHLLEDAELTETAAFTVPGAVVLRNSIYEGLFADDPFSRYTVAHEFSHIVLDHSVTLHRGAVLGEHGWFEDSEWQANNLAAELMMPLDVVKNLGGDPHSIMQECGVSAKAAQYRVQNLRNEGLIR